MYLFKKISEKWWNSREKQEPERGVRSEGTVSEETEFWTRSSHFAEISIIGAGAAGMMTAATLVEQGVPGDSIHLFDGNARIGRKVAITGGGRCNVTTGLIKKQDFLPKYIRGSGWLEHALSKLGPKKVREWFESHGVALKVEDDLRVFPVSDRGEEIIECFENILARWGVRLHLGEKVRSVEQNEGKYTITTPQGIYTSDILVITTGGNAYSGTGSVGDGYDFARTLGHSVTRLAPSLASFLTAETWCEELSGLSLPLARFEADHGLRVDGPMLFTHFGISGPATFALSAHLAFETVEKNAPYRIRLIPDRDRNFDTWEHDLVEDFEANPSKTLRNILGEYFPRRFIETILHISHLDGEKRASHVSRDERRTIVKLFTQGIPLSLTGRKPGDEFVTAGGVDLGEVDPETMESKLHRELYFAGEVLDIDAVTGGFNLQGCWATGRACGIGIATRMASK